MSERKEVKDGTGCLQQNNAEKKSNPGVLSGRRGRTGGGTMVGALLSQGGGSFVNPFQFYLSPQKIHKNSNKN